MKFCHCTVMVKNMEDSLKFYQEIVGLPLTRRFPAGPGREIAFLGGGETQVELIEDKEKSAVRHSEDISLGFEVASLDEMMAFIINKGLKVHSGPFQPNPNVRFFYVADPDGVKIQFIEFIK